MNKKFLMYENCIPVLGNRTSLIMDLQRNEYYEITNLMCEILLENTKKNTVNELKKKYNYNYDEGIDDFFDFLISEDLGFYTFEPERFPKINKLFKSPWKLLTSVIVYSEKSNYSLKEVFLQLIDLGCQSIQLRLYSFQNLSYIKKVINLTKKSRVSRIEIFIESFDDYDFDDYDVLKEMMTENLRVYIYAYPYTRNNNYENFKDYQIEFLKNGIDENEIISLNLLTCNTQFYIESLKHNVGLNRKICIDSIGNIKNYITHTKTFGNISNTKLKNVLNLETFKEKWFVSNDEIEKCKNCQYRYMCLSNSDIIMKEGKYFKIDYCTFNI